MYVCFPNFPNLLNRFWGSTINYLLLLIFNSLHSSNSICLWQIVLLLWKKLFAGHRLVRQFQYCYLFINVRHYCINNQNETAFSEADASEYHEHNLEEYYLFTTKFDDSSSKYVLIMFKPFKYKHFVIHKLLTE